MVSTNRLTLYRMKKTTDDSCELSALETDDLLQQKVSLSDDNEDVSRNRDSNVIMRLLTKIKVFYTAPVSKFVIHLVGFDVRVILKTNIYVL